MKCLKEIIGSIRRNKKQFAAVFMSILIGMAGGGAAIYLTCFDALLDISILLGFAVLLTAVFVGGLVCSQVVARITDTVWGWD